jgi:Ca2+-binding RTX toxin-like protein
MVVLKNKPLLTITLAVLMAAGLLVAGLMALVEPAEGAFPGQNGKIAFTSSRDGNFEIYTMNTTGGALDRLTNNTQNDIDPDWQSLPTGAGGGTTPSGCTITGTPGNDNNLVGTNGPDKICGLGGNDTLRGRKGNDELIAGPGTDEAYGEKGTDSLDTQDGVNGNDLAKGGKGSDTCTTDPGDTKASC